MSGSAPTAEGESSRVVGHSFLDDRGRDSGDLAELMRAARFHDFGPPEVLVVEQIARPEPGAGEVLVRVYSAGVNPVDWRIRQGQFREHMPIQLPYVTGRDLAGVVAAIGPGVSTLWVGQAVYGQGIGTCADYAIAHFESVSVMPGNLRFDQAAAVPVAARTAWMNLFDLSDLHSGQRVLVHGAAGGVGSFAVQLAHWTGAYVIGTASARNVEFVRSLGADQVLDYNSTPFEQVVRDVDLVLDTVGGSVRDRSWTVVKPGGMLLSLVPPSAAEAARQHGVRTAEVAEPTKFAVLLPRISKLMESGAVKPVVGELFSLDEIQAAHRLSESGHGRGRIIVHIADELI